MIVVFTWLKKKKLHRKEKCFEQGFDNKAKELKSILYVTYSYWGAYSGFDLMNFFKVELLLFDGTKF